MSVQSGKVKFYDKKKFFGFIVDDTKKKDVFFHGSQIPDDYEPSEGDRVSYEIQEGKKGLMAVNVQPE